MLGRFARHFPVLPLTPEPLEKYLVSIPGSQDTRAAYSRVLNALYHFLEERKKIPRNPDGTPLVNVPRIPQAKKLHLFLDHDQLVHLMGYTKGFQERALLYLLIDSKSRIGEVLSIDRKDVHPDHITVRGKTGERQAPISPDTSGMLLSLATEGPVFTVDGKRMTYDFAYDLIHDLMVRAGLTGPKLGPHLLRHSAAVDHIVQGGDLSSLQEELGHVSPAQTAHYSKLAFKQTAAAHQRVNVLGKLLAEAQPVLPGFGDNGEKETQDPQKGGVS